MRDTADAVTLHQPWRQMPAQHTPTGIGSRPAFSRPRPRPLSKVTILRIKSQLNLIQTVMKITMLRQTQFQCISGYIIAKNSLHRAHWLQVTRSQDVDVEDSLRGPRVSALQSITHSIRVALITVLLQYLKLWAPVTSSVGNFQLSVGKVQLLCVLLRFLTYDALLYEYSWKLSAEDAKFTQTGNF